MVRPIRRASVPGVPGPVRLRTNSACRSDADTPRLRATASLNWTTSTCHSGIAPKPFFWLVESGKDGPRYDADTHVAFTCDDRATVDAFHAAATAAGGTSLRAPGVWAEYHPDYYGAFVADPSGVNIEAVCHTPTG